MAKAKFKVGDKVVVVADGANHQVPTGTTGVVTFLRAGASPTLLITGFSSYLYFTDVRIARFTRQDLLDDKARLNKELQDVENKLKFLDATGGEEYDPDVERCYTMLKTLNSGASDLEKAKLITTLFRG